MHGFDTYDYGARGYHPASGRYMTVDPLCEMKPWQSPYMYCSGNPVNRTDPTGMVDGLPDQTIPEVTVTAPYPANYNSNSSSSVQFIDYVNRNSPQIPRITPLTPSFKLPTNTNANNVGNTNNKDSKKSNGILQDISDVLTAAGVASGSFEVAVRNEAGNEIVYVTMKGTEAAVLSTKVLTVLKGIGNATIVLGVVLDFSRSYMGDPKQPWSKTIVNTGVAVVVGVIGGGLGLTVGATYYIVDNTIGWDRVLKAGATEQWKSWHQSHGTGSY